MLALGTFASFVWKVPFIILILIVRLLQRNEVMASTKKLKNVKVKVLQVVGKVFIRVVENVS